MKYLVTGGCGFIGSHLVDALLAQGHQVRVLDNLSTGVVDYLPDQVELVLGDVADLAIVKGAMSEMDGCFHLAAIASVEQSNSDWVGTHKVNQQGSVNVFEAARYSGSKDSIPVVYASSAAIYGDNATIPLDETSAPRPISAYGADKLGSEHHARVAWLNHKVSTVGMRFFNVYGPRQNPSSPYSGVISIFIDRILNNLPISIFGDGKQTRDFIYVADVVKHLIAAMENTKGEASVFNVCTGQSTSILQLARTLSMVAGVEVNIEHKPARTGDIATSLGDPSRASARLGLRADVGLGTGMAFTVEAMKENSLKETG
ncbi:NAD-dependent epimerase/dehydratase family protein [Neptuniibacter sp. SY11_33]|uniref:NAD-dependent epimerase/dehydratase family protein n=1 Tax=Neptuniibacter sp. SY11_33 TaxID=3398215 RepID=UPI0039F44E86